MIKIVTAAALLGAGLLVGCANEPKAPAISDNVSNAIKQAGIKDISVSQDRDKGVVTLKGNVPSEDQKTQAQQIAQSTAGNQVVANEIGVVPSNNSGTTKKMYTDLDKGISNNLDAALAARGYTSGIRHSVKNGVVTLTGNVNDETQRQQVQSIAQSVPNAQQVVNELQTKHERATSTTANR
jgi:hyperosmotically inducible periplasmic protein